MTKLYCYDEAKSLFQQIIVSIHHWFNKSFFQPVLVSTNHSFDKFQQILVSTNHCFDKSLFQEILVSTNHCFSISLFQQVIVSTNHCFNISLFQQIAVSANHCFNKPLLQPIIVSAYFAFKKSLLQQISVSTSHCFNKSLFQQYFLWEGLQEGDLSRWPHPKDDILHIVRVRLVGGQESLLNKFKELKVRAHVVRELSFLYLQRQWHILERNPGVQAIHAKEHCESPYASMEQHIRQIIDENYPEALHGMPHGAVIPELTEVVAAQISSTKPLWQRERVGLRNEAKYNA